MQGVSVYLVSQFVKGPEGQCLLLSGLIVTKMWVLSINISQIPISQAISSLYTVEYNRLLKHTNLLHWVSSHRREKVCRDFVLTVIVFACNQSLHLKFNY